MEIEYLNPKLLKVAQNNPRTHSDKQIKEIANSITEFGFTNPILIDEQCVIIAGHCRQAAALFLKINLVPCIKLVGLTEAQRRAYVIADNQLPQNAGWDLDLLKFEIEALQDLDFNLDVLGFDEGVLDDFLCGKEEPDIKPVKDIAIQDQIVTVQGDVWILGDHRIMCGDSIDDDDVSVLCKGDKAQLLHADPPYGMGKEVKGVEGDNIYGVELDKFQMDWWRIYRKFIVDNASVYIWGNAPDLWRLWYVGGLKDSGSLNIKNEIVWDKKGTHGMGSHKLTKYAVASERCLFFCLGGAFVGPINSEDYWEGWDELRLYLEGQAKACELSPAKCLTITGSKMYSHWFSKSQWGFISAKNYIALQVAYPGFFEKSYSDLKIIYERLKNNYRNLSGQVDGVRAYFNNTHDAMRDTWEFGRCYTKKRYTHATPKPVDMMKRIMRTSLPREGLCIEPFGGSGSTIMGAEKTGRRCYTMETQPKYVDISVIRWQNFTRKKAVHEMLGISFDELRNIRGS